MRATGPGAMAAGLAVWGSLCLASAPAEAACSTTEMDIAIMAAQAESITSNLGVARRFEELAAVQGPDCAEALFLRFRSFWSQARTRYAQENRIPGRRWPLLEAVRESERGPVARDAARAGWVLVEDEKGTTPLALEEDPWWMAARFGSLLPLSWREYFEEQKREQSLIAEYGGLARTPPGVVQEFIVIWNGFLARYPAFADQGNIYNLVRRYKGALPPGL